MESMECYLENAHCHWKRNEREEELWLLRKIEEGYLRSGADEKDCCAACFMYLRESYVVSGILKMGIS